MDWPQAKKILSERYHVALVEPRYQGNIGAVARAMNNNGFDRLVFVNGPPLLDEAFQRAVNSEHILSNAKLLSSFRELRDSYGTVVGTSSVDSLSSRKFLRRPMDPDEFWDRMSWRSEQVVIVFGREGDGLYNSELEMCDYFIHIPANPDYPVFNLSHAVSIFLHRGFLKFYDMPEDQSEKISDQNLSRLVEGFSRIMNDINYPEYKRRNTDVMIRRMLARASLTQTEFFKMMGILRHTAERLEEKDRKGL